MSQPVTFMGAADFPHCGAMVRSCGSINVYVNSIPVSRQFDFNTPHLASANPIACTKPLTIHRSYIAIGSVTVFTNSRGAGRMLDPLISIGVPTNCTWVAQGSPTVFAGG